MQTSGFFGQCVHHVKVVHETITMTKMPSNFQLKLTKCKCEEVNNKTSCDSLKEPHNLNSTFSLKIGL